MLKRQPLPTVLDEDWIEIAGNLEDVAQRIRDIVQDDSSRDTTARLRAAYDSDDEYAFLLAAVRYGKPKGWTENGEPTY
jgi:hypothetical protein